MPAEREPASAVFIGQNARPDFPEKDRENVSVPVLRNRRIRMEKVLEKVRREDFLHRRPGLISPMVTPRTDGHVAPLSDPKILRGLRADRMAREGQRCPPV